MYWKMFAIYRLLLTVIYWQEITAVLCKVVSCLVPDKERSKFQKFMYDFLTN